MLRRALVELAAGLEDGRTGCVAALTGVQPLAWDGGQVLRRWSVVEIARRVPCADRPHAFFALQALEFPRDTPLAQIVIRGTTAAAGA